jgi:probable phosphoglycerate mutase
MSRIVLVRHGETVWHAQNRYAGRSDIALTPKGLQQAQQLAAWARGANLAAVWSSPLSRARLTAQPAATAIGMSLRVDERLVELDFGRGEGLTDAEMNEQFPEERAAFMRNPVTYHLPGGEDPAHAVRRGMAALHEIAAAAPTGRSLVVMHNTLVRLLLCSLLGIPLSRYRAVFPQLANGTLTEIHLSQQPGGNSALLSFNTPLKTE